VALETYDTDYRVRIASKTGGSETIRGCEIADDVPSVNQLIFSM
jgi:hypothetical protein